MHTYIHHSHRCTIHTCTHSHCTIHICTHSHRCTTVHIYIYLHIFTQMHNKTYIDTCIHMHNSTYLHVHTDTQQYIHTYMHTYIAHTHLFHCSSLEGFVFVFMYSDPPLDPKYFQKREDSIPVRGMLNSSSSPPTIPHLSGQAQHQHQTTASMAPQVQLSSLHAPMTSVRLNQQMIVPKSSQPPLASAYFPGQNRPS